MRNMKEMIEELRKPSGLMTEAADLIENLQKENEFHRKTVQENAQKAMEVSLEEIEKAKKEAKIEATEEIFKNIELRFGAFYYKIEAPLNEVKEDYIKELNGESK